MTSQEIQHNFFIRFSIAWIIIPKWFILMKFQLTRRIEIIIWLVNEHLLVILEIFRPLRLTSKISQNQEISKRTFNNLVLNHCSIFLQRVKSINDMKQPNLTYIKQLRNFWFCQFNQYFSNFSKYWITK